MKILIGIDDTDNLESRGTGFLARELGRLLQENGLGNLMGITRHQLLFDRRIPYTSHNSSACLEIESDKNVTELVDFCADFLLNHSAEGSDAGLCIASYDEICEDIIQWGLDAKRVILTQENARALALKNNIFLEGYTGTKGGIIGSLAAIGLRKAGNDGRYLWVKNMREMFGVYTASEILSNTGVQEILSVKNEKILPDSKILLSEKWRPVLKNHKIVTFVESKKESDYEWQVVSKDYIKSISN